jgi:hypothetical protein
MQQPAEAPKTEIYQRMLAQLAIGQEIEEFRRELDQRRDRFLQSNLSTEEEKRETNSIFQCFYSAVMTQQNKNWSPKKLQVFQYLPPDPALFYSALRNKSDDEIRGFCERHLHKAGWVSRYKRVRSIAQRFLELEHDYGGVRRYFREVYLNKGAEEGLVNEIVRDSRLPGIGPITVLNSLRDSFGLDLVKPDVVLKRIFYNLGWTEKKEKNPATFLRICREIGIHRPAVVDHVFWILGNANGKPAWNVDRQHCSGEKDKDFIGCKHPCFCSTYCNGNGTDRAANRMDGGRV